MGLLYCTANPWNCMDVIGVEFVLCVLDFSELILAQVEFGEEAVIISAVFVVIVAGQIHFAAFACILNNFSESEWSDFEFAVLQVGHLGYLGLGSGLVFDFLGIETVLASGFCLCFIQNLGLISSLGHFLNLKFGLACCHFWIFGPVVQHFCVLDFIGD